MKQKYNIYFSLVCLALIISSINCGSREPPKKEMEWHREALVLTAWQDWGEIGDDLLKLYGVSGNKNEWTYFQFFAGNGGRDLYDEENYKKWRQCIFRKDYRRIKYCREEEWAYSSILEKWILLNRTFYDSK